MISKRFLQRACLLVILIAMILLPVRQIQAAASVAWPTTASEANSSGRWPELSEVPCGAYLVLDRGTGKVLLEKHADAPMYPASTTKILTALLALEHLDMNAIVTVSPEALRMPAGSSKVGYRAGERVVVKDLLAGMMLASGNDAANVVAEAVSGSQAQFALLMNDRARKAGATNSNFVNPSGTHHEAHVTTAIDLAVIASEAMQNPLFRELVSLESCSLPATNLHPLNGWAVLINTNRLMVFDDTYFHSDLLKAVTGVKTGSTNMAGDCLVASAIPESGSELIGVLLKVPFSSLDANKAVYMRTLLEAGVRKRHPETSLTPAVSVSPTSGPTSQTVPSSSSAEPGETSASTTIVSESTTAVSTTSSQAATTATSSQSADAGVMESLRLRFGIDQSTFTLVAVLVGILIGILVGMAIVLSLWLTTHKHAVGKAAGRPISGRRSKRR